METQIKYQYKKQSYKVIVGADDCGIEKQGMKVNRKLYRTGEQPGRERAQKRWKSGKHKSGGLCCRCKKTLEIMTIIGQ